MREGLVAAANPFQHHGRVFLLFVAIVSEDGLQLGILAGVDALVVPVDRLELFHQRNDRAMHVAGFVAQFLDRFVVALVGHGVLLVKGSVGQQHAGTARLRTRGVYAPCN